MLGWSDSYSIGVPQIDSQHKQLFAIIKELHEAMLNRQSAAVLGKALDNLTNYTVTHFSTEEGLLRSVAYTELPQHKLIHEQFVAKMKQLQQQYKAGALNVNIELMNFLQKWLIDHIQGTDRKYVAQLGSRT